MAGIEALLNQRTGGAQGNLNPQLYQMAARVPVAFHDATVASSGVTSCSAGTPSMCNNSMSSSTGLLGGQAGYLLTAGYDEVTGLGSLDVQAFIDNYLRAGATTPTVTVSGTVVTVARGATTGNTSTITVTPAYGFTGSTTLTATITSSPVGAQSLPTLSFGSTSPVSITNFAAATATLTINTMAPSSGALAYPVPRNLLWPGAGAVLAGLLFFPVSRRRRNLSTILGMLGLLVFAMGGMLACGGNGTGAGGGSTVTASPGTTPGTYAVTVTCASAGSTMATGTLTVHVQ
jgi:pseudomonalisin